MDKDTLIFKAEAEVETVLEKLEADIGMGAVICLAKKKYPKPFDGHQKIELLYQFHY